MLSMLIVKFLSGDIELIRKKKNTDCEALESSMEIQKLKETLFFNNSNVAPS